jgi:hypothetical protein
MPKLSPIDDIATYRAIADRLMGKVPTLSDPNAVIDPRIMDRTAPGRLSPEGQANFESINSALRAKTEGASRQTQRNASWLAHGIPLNYEGMAASLAKSHGPEVVNGLMKILPTLTPAQMNVLAPLLSKALDEGDAGRQTPLKKNPPGYWE